VFELAAQVARVAVARPDLPQAVRRTGVEPEHREIGTDALREAVEAAVRDLADAVEGTIAVVTPAARRTSVADWLGEKPYSDRLSVLDGLASKGLEFDGVVVVEPTEVVTESASGWRTLYVVLTRATQRLISVGTGPFPLDDRSLVA
jgi:DNA helicase IV